jgi:hypothetical protein
MRPRITQDGLRYARYLRWLAGLLFLELILAFVLPSNVLELAPWIEMLSRMVEGWAPIVGRFDEGARNPQLVRAYVTLTLLLVPLKVAYWLAWLHSDYQAKYRDLVVSPLTADRPVKTHVLVGPQVGQHVESKTRSLLSRIIWSLAALAFCTMLLYVFVYLAGDSSLRTRGRSMLLGLLVRWVESGGALMWMGWSVVYTTFLGVVIAIALCIGRDYAAFAYLRFTKGTSIREGEK